MKEQVENRASIQGQQVLCLRKSLSGTSLSKYAFILPLVISAFLTVRQIAPLELTGDGAHYLQIARNIHFGAGLGWQALWFPPLHSLLIAFAAWLPGLSDLQLAAAAVSAVMGILLPLAVYLLAREIFGTAVALAAAVIAALFPHFIALSKSMEPEITYTVLLLFSLWTVAVAVRKDSWKLAVLGGALFSLAYLSRSEGFLVMFFTLSFLLLAKSAHASRKQLLGLVLAVTLAFFLVSLPYLLFLKHNYGGWVLSPKTTYVLIWMKTFVYHDNDKGESQNEDLWGLTPDGKFKWQRPAGVGELATYLMSHPARSLQVYAGNLLAELPGRIPNGSGKQHYPQPFPVVVAVMAVFAAFRRWDGDSAIKKCILLAPLSILLVLPVFTGGWWKYLVPYAPLLLIAGTAGIFFLAAVVEKRVKSRVIGYAPWGLSLLLAACFYCPVYCAGEGKSAVVKDKTRSEARELEKELGLALRKAYGPGHNYMTPCWNRVIYYTEGLWTAEPVVPVDELYQYAARNGVEYLIVEYKTDREIKVDDIRPVIGRNFIFDRMFFSADKKYAGVSYRVVRGAGR